MNRLKLIEHLKKCLEQLEKSKHNKINLQVWLCNYILSEECQIKIVRDQLVIRTKRREDMFGHGF